MRGVKPLVSVIVPVYNAAAYLPAAIESILRQDYRHFELILVDDGSTDGSPAIIRRYARRDTRIRPLFLERLESRCSGGHATNAGIAVAQGEYIARMDGDDLSLPRRLATQVAWLERTECDICGAHGESFGASNKAYRFSQHHEAIRHELLFRICLFTSAVMMRGEVARSHPFDAGTACEDYEYWTRLAPRYRLGNVPEVLIRYRIHEGQNHSVHRENFVKDMLKHRFRYFYTLFPKTPLAEYLAFSRLAERLPMQSLEELERAGQWLANLARPRDPCLHEVMGGRWDAVCRLSSALGPRVRRIHRHFGAQLATHVPPREPSVP